jgi:hypothetical protein
MHVDLQERHQLDAARQHVAKVKARAKPWQSIFALIVAVVAATVSAEARRTADLLALPPYNRGTTWLSPLGRPGNLALEYGGAVAFLMLAGFATIGLGNKAREVLQASVGSAHAAVVRFAILVVGGLATIIVTLQLLNIDVTQLILGGAVTGVVVGIAAQQSLANVFAGIVLLVARPFQVGDRVGIRAGALSGLIEGTVTEISVTYVRLETAGGPVHIPNSQVLAAAVGRGRAGHQPAGQGPPPGQGTPPPGPGSAPDGPATPAPPGPAQERAAAEAGPPGASAAPAAPFGPTQPESPGPEPQPGAGRQPS